MDDSGQALMSQSYPRPEEIGGNRSTRGIAMGDFPVERIKALISRKIYRNRWCLQYHQKIRVVCFSANSGNGDMVSFLSYLTSKICDSKKGTMVHDEHGN